jgi:hypothetical protein
MILFYVAMSEVTKVGIGGFSGERILPITLPGTTTQVDLSCSWGPSSGMFLGIIGIIGFFIILFQKKLITVLKRFLLSQ